MVPAFGPGVRRPLAASGAVPARLGSRSEAADSGELGSRSPDGSDPELGSRSSTAGATGPEAELGSRQSHRSAAQLGSRPEGGPGQLGSRFDPASGSDLGSRSGDGADADLGSRSPAPTPAAARPHRLPDGSWGSSPRRRWPPATRSRSAPPAASPGWPRWLRCSSGGLGAPWPGFLGVSDGVARPAKNCRFACATFSPELIPGVQEV